MTPARLQRLAAAGDLDALDLLLRLDRRRGLVGAPRVRRGLTAEVCDGYGYGYGYGFGFGYGYGYGDGDGDGGGDGYGGDGYGNGKPRKDYR